MENINQPAKMRLFEGIVVSNDMEKTVVVEVRRTYQHPQFQKVIRAVKKFKVHDPREEAQVGDVVEFYETRPISKTKHMHLHRILKTAQGVE